MHDINDPRNILASMALQCKDCIGCGRSLELKFFNRDSSFRDGHRDMCDQCANAPRLSIAEHTRRVHESNMNSAAVQAQRWDHQDDYRDDIAREGRRMSQADLITRLRQLIPGLYFTDGRMADDVAVFRVYGTPQPHLEGRDFEYLLYIPGGLMPEYSTYEFDGRDIPIREKQRGWRTVLLNLIMSGLISTETCRRVFGEAIGPASNVWYRKLWSFRNCAAA